MRRIPVVIIGTGGVGRQLIQHIVDTRRLHAKQGLHIGVVGICDSRSLLLVNDAMVSGMSDECLLEICKLKASAAFLPMLSSEFGNFEVFGAAEIPGKLMATAGGLGRITGLAFVDCSASSETVGLLNQVIELGCCVVLANKKPLTSDMEVYDKLVSHPRRIRYESTVGAGLPVITSLNRILSSGDPINRIVGSLSGTLGYLMSELEDGKPFSQVVRAAKNLGFTEPDPRDDFGGMDVARKALILARLLGWRINMENIKVDSLYPAEMGPNMISTEEFLSKGVLMLDNDFAQRVQLASSNGKVLRYVCMLEKSRVLSMIHPNIGSLLSSIPLTGKKKSYKVYKIKNKPDGSEEHYKARLVAKGSDTHICLVSFVYAFVYLKRSTLPLVSNACKGFCVWGGRHLNPVRGLGYPICQVGLLECPKDSPLGKLKGSANMVEIYSRCYSFPLVIQGAGAGNDTTAAGVLADILDLQDIFC